MAVVAKDVRFLAGRPPFAVVQGDGLRNLIVAEGVVDRLRDVFGVGVEMRFAERLGVAGEIAGIDEVFGPRVPILIDVGIDLMQRRDADAGRI